MSTLKSDTVLIDYLNNHESIPTFMTLCALDVQCICILKVCYQFTNLYTGKKYISEKTEHVRADLYKLELVRPFDQNVLPEWLSCHSQ